MTELSKVVYRASKGELRTDELTQDGTTLARFQLSPEERNALKQSLDNGQWANFAPNAYKQWL
jgi:hypothetical protein